MYILYIIVLKIKLITNLHALSVAIHVHSNMVLEEQHPDVADELHNDNVSIHKSRRYFSVLVVDQEQ